MVLRLWLATALALLLIGCNTAQSTPTPTQAPPSATLEGAPPTVEPTRTRTPSTDTPTLTLAATVTETAVATAELPDELPPAEVIEPLVEDGFIQFVGWSDDGAWTVFWRGAVPPEGADPSDAVLTFYQVETGQMCMHPDFAYSIPIGLRWAEDGTAMVSLGGSVTLVTPCGESEPTALPAFPFGPDSPARPSPDDAVLAYTYELSPADETNRARVETIIRENGGGPIFARAEWTTPGGLGSIGAGGEWISDDLFLIWRTADRGPLLLGMDGSVIEVAPDLFGAPAVPETTPGEEYMWAADGVSDGEGNYHLMLYGVGIESAFPPVQLFHSETGTVETLEFTHVWEPTFSPDGQWLLLMESRVVSDQATLHLWARRVDPAGSTSQDVASGSLYTKFDPGWTRVAMSRAYGAETRGVEVYTFPGGELLGVWDTRSYDVFPVAWSPDGARLVLVGTNTGQQALFVVEP